MTSAPVDSSESTKPPKSGSSSRILIWLIILSLAFLFLPLFLVFTEIQESIPILESELAVIQATLATTPQPNPESERLRATLVYLREQNAALTDLADELIADHLNWPATMEILSSYDQGRISFTSLIQSDNRLTLSGVAREEADVISFTERLRESPFFQEVTIQSITLRLSPTIEPSSSQGGGDSTGSGTGFTVNTQNSFVEFSFLVELSTNVP